MKKIHYTCFWQRCLDLVDELCCTLKLYLLCNHMLQYGECKTYFNLQLTKNGSSWNTVCLGKHCILVKIDMNLLIYKIHQKVCQATWQQWYMQFINIKISINYSVVIRKIVIKRPKTMVYLGTKNGSNYVKSTKKMGSCCTLDSSIMSLNHNINNILIILLIY